VLKCTVYNLRRSVRYPWNPAPCTDPTEQNVLCTVCWTRRWHHKQLASTVRVGLERLPRL